MDELIDLSKTKLESEGKAAVTTLCKVLLDTLDPGLKSITIYGSAVGKRYRPGKSDINLLVVLEHIDVPILKSVVEPVAQARRYGIAPFFITEANLLSSTDVFPVKFLTMKESYRVLWGQDLLGKLEISREHLRLRCEQEFKNLLLRLRWIFLKQNGRGLTETMSRRIVGFLANLRMVLTLVPKPQGGGDKVIDAAAKVFEIDGEVLRRVIALKDIEVSLPREDEENLYDQFMAIVYKVAQKTSRMEITGDQN